MPYSPPEDILERALAPAVALGPAALIAVILLALGVRTLPRSVAGLALIMGPFAGLSSLAGILLSPLIGMLDPPVPASLGEAFLGAAIPEEVAKLAVLVTIVLRHPDAERGRDAILAAGWLGLGFAAFENFFYVTGSQDWLSIGALRFATAVPFHVALGMIMGLFLERAGRGGQSSDLALALAVPVILHGLYDWPLMALAALKGGDATATIAYDAIFALTLVVTAVLVCLPVARTLRGRVWRPVRPSPVYSDLLDRAARAISVLLRLGAAICVLTAVVAAVSIDSDHLHFAAMAIMPYSFGEFWQRAV